MESNEMACFTPSHSYLDHLLDVDNSLKFGGTITINTNKLSRFQDEKEIRGIIGHEIQHAVQEIEGFAMGGDPNTIHEDIQQEVNNQREDKDFIVSNLKQWAVLTDMANNLESSTEELQRDGKVWQDIGRRHYWDAMNEIDTHVNEKYNLKNEYEKDFGKDFNDLEVAKSGYHVHEAAEELRRQAQACKDKLTSADYFTLNQLNIMEESLEKNNANQTYRKLAGEVEARNTSKRVGMSPFQRRDTLASETEDVQLDSNERRDLAKNLLDYSRGKMPDSYEAKSKETLVRCVAMEMLGNLYEFQHSEKVPGSNGLIARLERDPAFSKEILDKASASASKVSTFVEENVRSFGEDKKLDLRSLTPIDLDVDGNGVVESQENLDADKKQGVEESSSTSQDTSHRHRVKM